MTDLPQLPERPDAADRHPPSDPLLRSTMDDLEPAENPDIGPQTDAVEWLERNLPERDDPPAPASTPPQPAPAHSRDSAATELVKIALGLYDLGRADSGETFGVPKTAPKIVRMLRGDKNSLRAQLSREFFTRNQKAAPQQALADALTTLDGFAHDAEKQRLYQRVAEHDNAWWLDLGDGTGRAVRIGTRGWTVEEMAPVLFRRTVLTDPLPDPVRGADLDELWEWLNVAVDDRPLIIAWLVCALLPDVPHPILAPLGEHGAGKTTAGRVIGSIIDPSPVPTRTAPRDVDGWITAASGSWIVGIDNVSEIAPWLSDSLCRSSTGEGSVRRKLYSDGELVVFAFRRCVILNGIDYTVDRGDLADRLLPIHLDVIPESARLAETDLWPKWAGAHPRIFGALLDLAARLKAVLPSVELARKPRMADFAIILAAVDTLLGTDGLSRYVAKQGELARESLGADLGYCPRELLAYVDSRKLA